MNIFILDWDVDKCAHYHNDRHIVKMPTELAQCLSTAKRYFEDTDESLYRSTHVNHPSNKWIREGKDNYLWTFNLLKALLVEYDFRYNPTKHQRAKNLLEKLSEAPSDIPAGWTKPRLAMPEQYQLTDPVEAYRLYYIKDKQHLAKWSKRSVPEWYK